MVKIIISMLSDMERWQSGRMRLTRNQLYSYGYREFESPSLRQITKSPSLMEGLLLSEVEERNLNFRKREFDKEEQARQVYHRTCDDTATSVARQSPSLRKKIPDEGVFFVSFFARDFL